MHVSMCIYIDVCTVYMYIIFNEVCSNPVLIRWLLPVPVTVVFI